MNVNDDMVDLQREIFHRVSNNFQIIQSMIRLISRDKSVTDPSREMEERIQMLSIVHHAQHCLESSSMHPLEQALPNLIFGVQGAGLLSGKTIGHTITGDNYSTQRGHALLHISVEALCALDRTDARSIVIAVTPETLIISSDATNLEPEFTTLKLTQAFAREFGGKVVWNHSGLATTFTK